MAHTECLSLYESMTFFALLHTSTSHQILSEVVYCFDSSTRCNSLCLSLFLPPSLSLPSHLLWLTTTYLLVDGVCILLAFCKRFSTSFSSLNVYICATLTLCARDHWVNKQTDTNFPTSTKIEWQQQGKRGKKLMQKYVVYNTIDHHALPRSNKMK